jgi:ABC-type sugar transport system permease subunit
MSEEQREVIVVDIKMRFWSMVVFMIKWVIASIPAFLILAILWALLMAVLGGLAGGWRPHRF